MEFDVEVELDGHGWPAAGGSSIPHCPRAGAQVLGDGNGAREVGQLWLAAI